MSGNNVKSDYRFAGIAYDPKFKKPPKHERKIKIDERFQSIFKNSAFKVKYTVDKRGRKISKSTSEDFKKFYDLSSDEENSLHISENEKLCGEQNAEKIVEDVNENGEIPSFMQEDIEKQQITREIREKLKDMNVDYARGEGKLFSESSSDESESEESESDNIFHEWNELDKDVEKIEKITNRLAICNMDWDRIRATDLMMMFNSFLPPKSIIHSVIVYPSEYGLQRMAEEEIKGPAELVNNPLSDESDDNSEEEQEEGKSFHVERMRQYQLNRLKYFYAVATFDTAETADYIYTNCNGIEYESSGIRLDLRFIDDEITFEQEPKDVCNSIEICQKYKPRFFTNTALQQAKVDLTWDETDPKRLEFTQKIIEAAKTDEINDSDLEDFVALSSSGEDENEENEKTFEDSISENNSENEPETFDEETDPILQYRNLLKNVEENDKENGAETDTELEITWGTESTKISKKSNLTKDENQTPFERLLQRRKEAAKIKKEKKKQKRIAENSDNEDEDIDKRCENGGKKMKKNLNGQISAYEEKQKNELELLLIDENEGDKRHFNFKKIQEIDTKNKKKRKNFRKQNKRITDVEQDDFEVDVSDDRFSALYSSHLYNIDPTNPKFPKTKGMKAFILEKQKRLLQEETNT
ncbi:hypothetical protein PGB90_001150 [Kerria lacca]